MTRRLARLILAVYPLAFRRRYADEMLALLDQTRVRPITLLDLLRGALLAHLRPPAAAGAVDPADRVRATVSGVLACWVAFAAAGFGYYKTTEDAPFTTVGHADRPLGNAHVSIQALALVASAAVLFGALPLIAAALAQAWREPRLRRLVSLPPLAVLVFAGLTAVLVVLAHSGHADRPTTVGGVAFIAWGLAGLGCGAVCVVAGRTALFAVAVSRWQLVTAFVSGAIVTAAMVGIALATALYTLALPGDSPSLAGDPNGPLQLITTEASLIVQLIVMVLLAGLAATATRRGWRASIQVGRSARPVD